MEHSPHSDAIETCGASMDLPQPVCTLPPGHRGTHRTTMIPESLAPVAASMVSESDRLHTELESARSAFAVWDRARARLKLAMICLIAVNVALLLLLFHFILRVT